MILYITKDELPGGGKVHDRLPIKHMNARSFRSFWGNEYAVCYASSFDWILDGMPKGACWKISVEMENGQSLINVLDKSVSPTVKAF